MACPYVQPSQYIVHPRKHKPVTDKQRGGPKDKPDRPWCQPKKSRQSRVLRHAIRPQHSLVATCTAPCFSNATIDSHSPSMWNDIQRARPYTFPQPTSIEPAPSVQRRSLSTTPPPIHLLDDSDNHPLPLRCPPLPQAKTYLCLLGTPDVRRRLRQLPQRLGRRQPTACHQLQFRVGIPPGQRCTAYVTRGGSAGAEEEHCPTGAAEVGRHVHGQTRKGLREDPSNNVGSRRYRKVK